MKKIISLLLVILSLLLVFSGCATSEDALSDVLSDSSQTEVEMETETEAPTENDEETEKEESSNEKPAECKHTSAGKATCTADAVCKDCGKTVTKALGHSFSNATCKAPKTCTRCGITEGDKGAHKFSSATCTSPKKCSVCGVTEGGKAAHKFSAATCTSPKKCSVCGATEGSALGHDYKKSVCTRCGTKDTSHTHSYTSSTTTKATCNAEGILTYTCSCGDSYTKSLAKTSHNWKDATCTEPETCTICGATDGEAEGHDYKSYSPHTCYDCDAVNPIVEETISKCSLSLPTLPATLNYYNYSDELESTVEVTGIDYKFEYYDDGKVTLVANFSGKKIYDMDGPGQSAACSIGWKLYDANGNVFRTGTLTTPSLAEGETFAGNSCEEDLIYNFEASEPGAFRLEILNTNNR